MPKSRARRKPARNSTRRPIPPAERDADPDLRSLITDEVLHDLELSLLAEASGDVVAAIQHFETSPLAASSPHLRYLHEIRDLGGDAPGWVWSRWILQQAHRHLYLDRDERLREALFVTMGNVYRDVDQDRPLGRAPQSFVGEVMALDWMCRQLVLYELGGLATYLDTMAKPPLLRRADRIMAWSAASMGAFRIEQAARGEATVTDLATGDRRQVLNLGWLAEGIGECVVGRLVPMRCGPGWIFESRPREVSHAVAKEVARVSDAPASFAWAGVLGDAVEAGELNWPLTAAACLTPLSSDLVPYTWSAPAGELSDAAYEVCAESLRAASCSERAALVAGSYVGAVLVNSHVHAAARERLTGAEHAAGWEALADNTHEPVRSRCLDLAARCRVAA